MKSIARALNNIAQSLNSIATAINNSKKIELKPSVTSNPYTSTNPVSNVTITTPNGFQEKVDLAPSKPFKAIEKVVIYKEEKEIIDALYKALTEKGINPAHHDKMIKQLSIGWPVLYKHLDRLIQFRKKNYNKSYSSHYPKNNDIWK